MPQLIDKPQLHATAQVAKSYILEQDTANVSTIINALQSSAKTTPTLSLGGWSSADSIYSAALTYNGDGNLSTSTGTISNGTLTVNDADGNFSGTVSAAEGTNYAASSLVFNYTSSQSQTPAKLEPTLTAEWLDDAQALKITYNGDGQLFFSTGESAYAYDLFVGFDPSEMLVYIATAEKNLLNPVRPDMFHSFYIHATEGTDYAAKTIEYINE